MPTINNTSIMAAPFAASMSPWTTWAMDQVFTTAWPSVVARIVGVKIPMP